jgi:hypothetical protein
MLDRNICTACRKDNRLTSIIGGDIFRADISQRKHWLCPIVGASVYPDQSPPDGCYKLFEYAVAQGDKRA